MTLISYSFSNAFEVPFNSKNGTAKIDSISKKFNKVAFAVMTIAPIQTLNESFSLTENKYYSSDMKGAKMSVIGRLRLRCIQDFMTVISEPTVDKAFYDKIIKKSMEENARQYQYFAQAHEVHKLVRFISPEAPNYVLDEIRKYFVVIYGSVNYVLDEMGTSTLSKDFKFGANFYELIHNAKYYALRIEILSNIATDGSILYKSHEHYDSEVREANIDNQLHLDNIPANKLLLDRYEDKINILFFFMALITTFRNIYKHHSGIPINVSIYNYSSLKIINGILNKDDKGHYKLKGHPGSTVAALKYFVAEYAPLKTLKSESTPDGQKWETILPIPDVLIQRREA